VRKEATPWALTRRQFTRAFKVQVGREIEAGKPLAQVARAYQVHPTVLRRGQQEHQRDAERAFAGHGHSYKDEARLAELERMIGHLTMEKALRKKAVLRLGARRREQNASGGSSWTR
jgi:transposase